MKTNIKPCLEQHFPDKAKSGTAVAEEAWFDAAHAHLRSARAIFDDDPGGAFLLGWASMHRTAKGIAAIGQCRLEGETHGKVVDFICCVFPELTNVEKGLVRLASTGRNSLSYDDPRLIDTKICLDVLALGEKLLSAAGAGGLPAPTKKMPPPPPPPPPAKDCHPRALAVRPHGTTRHMTPPGIGQPMPLAALAGKCLSHFGLTWVVADVDGDGVDERRVPVVVGGVGDRRVLHRCR